MAPGPAARGGALDSVTSRWARAATLGSELAWRAERQQGAADRNGRRGGAARRLGALDARPVREVSERARGRSRPPRQAGAEEDFPLEQAATRGATPRAARTGGGPGRPRAGGALPATTSSRQRAATSASNVSPRLAISRAVRYSCKPRWRKPYSEGRPRRGYRFRCNQSSTLNRSEAFKADQTLLDLVDRVDPGQVVTPAASWRSQARWRTTARTVSASSGGSAGGSVSPCLARFHRPNRTRRHSS